MDHGAAPSKTVGVVAQVTQSGIKIIGDYSMDHGTVRIQCCLCHTIVGEGHVDTCVWGDEESIKVGDYVRWWPYGERGDPLRHADGEVLNELEIRIEHIGPRWSSVHGFVGDRADTSVLRGTICRVQRPGQQVVTTELVQNGVFRIEPDPPDLEQRRREHVARKQAEELAHSGWSIHAKSAMPGKPVFHCRGRLASGKQCTMTTTEPQHHETQYCPQHMREHVARKQAGEMDRLRKYAGVSRADAERRPSMPALVDGITREQCLEKFVECQRADDGMSFWPSMLTPAQLTVAREEWSLQLKAKVEQSSKPKLTVMYCEVDADD